MFSAEQILLEQIRIKIGIECEVIIALDEVGRGCVAGPVLTCASLWISCEANKLQEWTSDVRDSKKLSPQKRLSCFNKVLAEFNYTVHNVPFKNSVSTPRVNLLKPKTALVFDSPVMVKRGDSNFKCIGFCLGEGDMAEVEQFNIWNAVQIAASRALLGLKEYFLDELNISFHKLVLLMDGNKPISVPASFLQVVQATAVKGDDLFLSVGLSSILAKVHRDLFMESQENIYPQFGFAKHKGYGTAFHLENIQKHGVCSLHRLSFLKKYI